MQGQSYILEYIIMFAVSFAIFSAIGFIFYNQSQSMSERVGEQTSRLVNDIAVADIMKIVTCKACNNITVKDEIPQKIGGFYYNISLKEGGIETQLIPSPIVTVTPTFNLNKTFVFSGEINSNNKKMEIQINNNLKEIGVS